MGNSMTKPPKEALGKKKPKYGYVFHFLNFRISSIIKKS